MIETIEFKKEIFPKLQSEGFAAQFCFPFAKKILKGTGYDIGYSKEEWKFPGAIGIEPAINPEFHATNLPAIKVDFILSSHCLEHVPDWVAALDHWKTRLHTGGVLFLYLPHYVQVYWRNFHNRKHVHNLSPQMLRDYLTDRGYKNIFVTDGYDLNYSFYAIAENN